MQPNLARYSCNFAFRTFLILAFTGSFFAGGCNFGGGHGGGGNGGGNGGGGGGPVFNITKTHQGNFTQGQQNATYTVTIKNIGGNKDAVLSTLSEQLPSGLTLVSMTGTGWTCSNPAPPTLPNCTRSDPIASGASFPPITVTVNVAANATSPQINQVLGDNNAQANDSTTILPAGGGAPAVVGTNVPFPIFAGDPATSIPITVTNDAAGDVLTASLTVDADTTFNCTAATCGTLGSVVGTSGSGNYSVSYTPPSSAGFTTQTAPTIVVTSNLPNSIGATDFIEVDPAGILVTMSSAGRMGTVWVGANPPDVRTLTATVYNDVTHAGVTFMALTAGGYACAILSPNSCGTLGTPSAPVVSGNTTTVTISYTPPASIPAAPYDVPRIQAVSVADNTRSGSSAIALSSDPVAPARPTLWISRNTKFKTALIGTAQTVSARILNDAGPNLTVNWALMAGGVICSPTCGTLSAPTTAVNGTTVDSTITYMPPSSVPTVAADVTPTITATSADNSTETGNFAFNILDPVCGTGNERVLNGHYAFLLRGGSGGGGYNAEIGSFIADGTGKVTGGFVDVNATSALFTGATILTAPTGSLPASSYSVGSDNRGCLTVADSLGGFDVYRFALGTLSGGVATQGRIILFDGADWRNRQRSGILMKQDTTSFNAAAFNGNYAYGEVGVDSNGGRFSGAGIVTSNGAGTFTSIIGDFDDAGIVSGNATGGSGPYTMTASGRGTATPTITVVGKSSTSNLILYMVSSSEVLFMTADPQSTGKPVISGEFKKQTGPFSATTLDNTGYVFYVMGIDPSNGGNDIVLGQTAFTTNGNATTTVDDNDNGVLQTEQTGPATFAIATNGRTTLSGLGAGANPPILYLIDSTSGFLVGTDSQAQFGFVEQQTGGPFSNASISGAFFFGGDAPTTASQYQSGTVNLDGAGNVTGSGDVAGPSGLKVDAISPSNGGTYSFSSSSTPVGKGTVGTNMIAYVISGSKIIFMSAGTDPEVFIVQK
jgi:uncharacterized repeat protein (TIGR01451 family)